MSESRSQATPARDELAEIIASRRGVTAKLNDIDRMMADRILDAGWSKPHTVNSATELDALPAGTVLRNNKSGRVFEKTRDKGAGKLKWMRMQDRWVYETYEILNESTWTVLFTPGDAG